MIKEYRTWIDNDDSLPALATFKKLMTNSQLSDSAPRWTILHLLTLERSTPQRINAYVFVPALLNVSETKFTKQLLTEGNWYRAAWKNDVLYFKKRVYSFFQPIICSCISITSHHPSTHPNPAAHGQPELHRWQVQTSFIVDIVISLYRWHDRRDTQQVQTERWYQMKSCPREVEYSCLRAMQFLFDHLNVFV